MLATVNILHVNKQNVAFKAVRHMKGLTLPGYDV